MTPFEQFRNKSYPIENKRVFAIVAESQRDIYEDHIRPACEAQELRCSSRFDLENPSNDPARIWAELQRSQMIVADITDLDSDVLCEVGIAISIRENRYIALLCRGPENGGVKPRIPAHLEKLHLVPYTDKSLDMMQRKLAELFIQAQLIDRRSGKVIQNLEARKLTGAAQQRTDERDWIAAEALFSAADQKESGNWYIFMCWGIMHRDQTEYALAEEKFDKALDCCELEQERARVYSEKALLVYRKDRDANTAEEWFRKAESADALNKQVFLSWAEFYEELGNYHLALEKVNYVLGQLDGDDEEARGRFDYYHAKLSDPPFKGSYKNFLNHREQMKRKPRPKTPVTGDSVPWNANWATLERYSGKRVRARVRDPHPRFGVFVQLCRDFDGLVPRRYLDDDYERNFPSNREVSVVIEEVDRNLNDNRPRITLRFEKS